MYICLQINFSENKQIFLKASPRSTDPRSKQDMMLCCRLPYWLDEKIPHTFVRILFVDTRHYECDNHVRM